MKLIEASVASPYQWVNLIFAGILALLFLYSTVFSPYKNNYPIHSQYDTISNTGSQSTGLSRSFSLIVRGKLNEAKAMNPHGIRLFSFFLIQLAMRLFLLFFTRKIDKADLQMVITTDAIISSGMFILFFEPFLRETFVG